MRQNNNENIAADCDDIDESTPWESFPARENGDRLLTFLRKRDLSFLTSDAVILEAAISEFLDPIQVALLRGGTPAGVAQWWCEQICIEAEAAEADIG